MSIHEPVGLCLYFDGCPKGFFPAGGPEAEEDAERGLDVRDY